MWIRAARLIRALDRYLVLCNSNSGIMAVILVTEIKMNERMKNPEDFLSVITGMRMTQWGSDLQIECEVDAVDRTPWVIHFKNCRKIELFVHEPEDVKESEAALISFKFGGDNYGAPAILGTDIFDLFVLYETLVIQKRMVD